MRTFLRKAARSPWDLSKAFYSEKSVSVASQTTSTLGLSFKTDGTKMYVVGDGVSVYQYALSTAWDVSSATYDDVSFDIGLEDLAPRHVVFKSDGAQMFAVGIGNSSVYQYTLSTPWNVGTAVYDSVSFSVGDQDTVPLGIEFKTDGTKLYVVGSDSDTVYQYSLSSAWDLSTASFGSVSLSITGQDTTPVGISFNADGTRMYILGAATDKVYMYAMTTAWDLSTATYSSVFFSVASQDSGALGLSFRADGYFMYMVGGVNDSVYQYAL